MDRFASLAMTLRERARHHLPPFPRESVASYSIVVARVTGALA
jgi:hypothetical protein